MIQLDNTNKVINGLWIGKNLSNIELLTLHSFIANGHTFFLWVYDDLDTPIPHGVELKNAHDIIPYAHVFCYKFEDPALKQGKGSYAGFSDIFRYKLLYERGGWWVDMDVTCLKPFTVKAAYFFKFNTYVGATGNLMKCPPQSDLMLTCYQQAVAQMDENNQDWLVPIRILNDNIKKKGLSKYIQKGFANEDAFNIIQLLLHFPNKINARWSAIHWMNEVWRINGLSKDKAVLNSQFQRLLQQYDLPHSVLQQTLNKRQKYHLILRGVVYPKLPILLRNIWQIISRVGYRIRDGKNNKNRVD